MFARSILRSAVPLRQSTQTCRSYATQSSASGGSNALLYGLGAVGLGGGGYYYFANVKGQAPPIPNVPTPGQKSASPATADSKAFLGGDQGFLSLKLKKVEDINHNTKKFIFALPDANQTSGLPVASALITKFQGEGMEKPVIRPYTPTSDEDEKGLLEFIIKKYPNGPMSEHIHSMKPGQSLDIKGAQCADEMPGPIPKYPVTTNKHDHIAMIAGGTGITPMYQVVRGIFKNPEDKTKVTLVFGNISVEDILLKKEFDELENTYPRRFRAFYTLDNPPEDWSQGKGHITKDLLKTVLPEPKEENIKIFVCGPPGLCKALSGPKNSPQDQGELAGVLKELGYSKDQVFKF